MQTPVDRPEIHWVDALVEEPTPQHVIVVFVCENKEKAEGFLSSIRGQDFELAFNFPDTRSREIGINYLSSDLSQFFCVFSTRNMQNSFLIRSLKAAGSIFISAGYKEPASEEIKQAEEKKRVPVQKNKVIITKNPVANPAPGT
jgi:hypothetical protein